MGTWGGGLRGVVRSKGSSLKGGRHGSPLGEKRTIMRANWVHRGWGRKRKWVGGKKLNSPGKGKFNPFGKRGVIGKPVVAATINKRCRLH